MENAKVEVRAIISDERSEELENLGLVLSGTDDYHRMVIDLFDISTFSELPDGGTFLVMTWFDSYEIDMPYDDFFRLYEQKTKSKIERCMPHA